MTAIAAARSGGSAVMSHYGETASSIKTGGSPVTRADEASSEAIAAAIARVFPRDSILCEETTDDLARLQASRLWIVDPLDGTKEFLSTNGEFSVMVGLVVDNELVLGVVYRPVGDELYAGVIGAGAFVQRAGIRLKLQCGQRDPREVRMVGSRSHADPRTDLIAAKLGVVDRIECGSVGLKCALISTGQADVYMHPVNGMGEWDTCAPEAILRAAGGVVTDTRGGPLSYNKPVPRQPYGILACAPGLEILALDALRSLQ